mgnify:CR=1 FL=1
MSETVQDTVVAEIDQARGVPAPAPRDVLQRLAHGRAGQRRGQGIADHGRWIFQRQPAVAPDFVGRRLLTLAAAPQRPAEVAGARVRDGYGAVFRHPAFIRVAPLGFVAYGGMVAMQTLWAGPWMVQVAGYSPQQAAAGLFTINLSMLVALNRPHELKLHVRGAINNGLSKEDIQEVFLQAAIYCGVPAAIDSFRCAKEVFTEMGI